MNGATMLLGIAYCFCWRVCATNSVIVSKMYYQMLQAGMDLIQHPICVRGFLENPSFQFTAKELHQSSGVLRMDMKARQRFADLFSAILDFYSNQDRKYPGVGMMSSHMDCHRWFVWAEHVAQSAATIRLLLRYKVDSAPEIVVTIEHSFNSEDLKMNENLESQYNCDYNDFS